MIFLVAAISLAASLYLVYLAANLYFDVADLKADQKVKAAQIRFLSSRIENLETRVIYSKERAE